MKLLRVSFCLVLSSLRRFEFCRRQSERMERPHSPGTKSVDIGETLESLLRFTLRSHLDETVQSLDLDLPRDLCFHLLEEEDTDSTGKVIRFCFVSKSLGVY